MAKANLAARYEAALIALGCRIAAGSRVTRYRELVGPHGCRIFIGSSGAVRYGATAPGIPFSDKFKKALLDGTAAQTFPRTIGRL